MKKRTKTITNHPKLLITLLLVIQNLIFVSPSLLLENSSFDVIVVGSGLAGLSAAIEAAEQNANLKILILDKESNAGGNSMKASSGFNAA